MPEEDLFSAKPESAPIESEEAPGRGGAPIQPDEFGAQGRSIEAPQSYTGGAPIGGPSSIFNIYGAPIAILGGVFSAGLPIGGPVSQVFRSGAVSPPTLFIATLTPSGPIGVFLVGSSGAGIGTVGEGGMPFDVGPFEGGDPIGREPGGDGGFGTISTGGQRIGLGGAGVTMA